ncbi:MAG TPA: hypothetical protein PLJ95_06825 [Candidatus Hydrogenedentes bacterium]|jgi:DNA polymerase III epsilon subunit-like protein|nr:MAG: hypothetical protein BWY07_00191 [Candidatus Hydrogenedentes bacterium ADurb.Bin170]HOD95148.1 hypothetical protein [Candidatus Hydrogenedentota bacterium]HPK24794.1 hypothetical protein [Candidatus Hydrogenedentota bacterium]
MRKNDIWAVLDIETSRSIPPAAIVQISCQRMRGWRADGAPFRMLLNQRVVIDPDAEAKHGFSREYLEEYGFAPGYAYRKLRDYAEDCPTVMSELALNWKHFLEPDMARTGFSELPPPRFCLTALAERLIPETGEHKAETLLALFQTETDLEKTQLSPDTPLWVILLRAVLRKRLNALGITGFEQIETFSKSFPVEDSKKAVREALEAPEQWYVLTSGQLPKGPYRLRHIVAMSKGDNWLVARKGAEQWTPLRHLPEFRQAQEANEYIQAISGKGDKPATKPILLGSREAVSSAPLFPSLKAALKKSTASEDITDSAQDAVKVLVDILREIDSLNEAGEAAVQSLRLQLAQCPDPHLFPLPYLSKVLESFPHDRQLQPEERQELLASIREILPLLP